MYIHRNFIHPGGVSPMKQEKVEEKKVEKEKTTVESIKEGAIGAWNMAGEAYKKIKEVPVIGDVVKHEEQKLSDVLAVASVPANIIAEAVEGLGGKGDKEFNISDAIPDLSSDRGSFNFKNMNGKSTKTVSAVTSIENPYLAFAVDLATDPSTYVGAGVVKNIAKKGIKKSTKALVKSSDNITNANKKQIIKAIDEGPTGPKPKGAVGDDLTTTQPFPENVAVSDAEALASQQHAFEFGSMPKFNKLVDNVADYRGGGKISNPQNLADNMPFAERLEFIAKNGHKDDWLFRGGVTKKGNKYFDAHGVEIPLDPKVDYVPPGLRR